MPPLSGWWFRSDSNRGQTGYEPASLPAEIRNHVKAYPPPRHYSNPLVYQGIRRSCVFGVAATGGSCGSSPQGGRRRGIVYEVANAVTFFHCPEICSIRVLNAGACPTVASGYARDRLWLWRAEPELNRQPPGVLQVCLPLSTSRPYCRHRGGDIILPTWVISNLIGPFRKLVEFPFENNRLPSATIKDSDRGFFSWQIGHQYLSCQHPRIFYKWFSDPCRYEWPTPFCCQSRHPACSAPVPCEKQF